MALRADKNYFVFHYRKVTDNTKPAKEVGIAGRRRLQVWAPGSVGGGSIKAIVTHEGKAPVGDDEADLVATQAMKNTPAKTQPEKCANCGNAKPDAPVVAAPSEKKRAHREGG